MDEAGGIKALLCRPDRELVPEEVLLSLPVLALHHRPPAQPGEDLLQVHQAPLLDGLGVHADLVVIPHT